MENNKNTGHMESTTLEKVPMSERKSWLSVALIQAGIMICVPSLLLGGILAGNMSFQNAIISGVIGYVIVIVIFSLMGVMGSDLGVPTCIAAIGGFGKQGSRFFISTLMFISMIGWFAVQNSVCGNAFTNLLSESFGINVSPNVSIVIWGIIMLTTAVYGINGLTWLNRLAVPALLIVTTVGTIMAMRLYGTEDLSVPVETVTMSIIDGIILTVSFMAVGCLAAADITRYQKTRKDTILSTTIGVMPAGILMVIMGAIMTKLAMQYDITLVFVEIGIPILGMLVLIAATWTTNTTNAYSGGIDAVLMFKMKENKRAVATMASGVLGMVLAMVGLVDNFESFLYILGDLLLPMMGVIIADYWILGKGKPENFRGDREWNVFGIIAWLSGYAVIKFVNVGIPFAQGIIFAAVLYVVLMRVFAKDAVNVDEKEVIA